MPRSGSGTYVLPSVTPPIQAGASIAAASMNTTLADLATAMTGSTAADGQTPITGNWDFNSKNISGVNTLAVTGTVTAANGTSGLQVVNYNQFSPAILVRGSVSFPGGLYIKWGTGTTTLGVGNVTYDGAFPTGTLNVQMTIGGGSSTTTINPILTATVNAAGFDVRGDATQSLFFYWLAIGY